MKSPDGGLAATLYGPCHLKTALGDQPIEIEQTGGYPFEEEIRLKVTTGSPVSFPLRLRIPAWCTAPVIKLNGKKIDAEIVNGFAILKRTFHSGDRVTLALPMKTNLTHWPEGGVAVEHGPLVYALPIAANWTPVVEERYTTVEYPSWNATPTAPWNYGLVQNAKITFEKGKLTDDPWSNPPSKLKVHVRRIEDWKLKEDRYTPPLADPAKSNVSAKTETVTLVPYGCTHLRLTIFPSV